jgi:hypothetical protein
MLVSLAITMIMMGAVVSLFGIISDSVSGSRSIIEMSERLRAARNRLQTDLQGATADMRPPLRPEADQGYFELIEGPMYDAQWTSSTTASIMGDVDDVLMFTTRSRGEPFVGLFNGPGLTTQSQTAEVIYFCAQTLDTSSPTRVDVGAPIDLTATPPIRTYTLYRRVLLVNPGLAGVMPALTNSYFTANDVSAKFVDAGQPMRPNSLGDLTKRENRFGHYALAAGSPGFPFNIGPSVPNNAPSSNATVTALGDPNDSYLRFGDDVLLTNVLSFDVQVYDPEAPLKSSAGGVLGPSDPGYATAGANVGTGAYVNLAWLPTGATPNTSFSRSAFRPISAQAPLQYLTPVLPVGGAVTSWTYDTWSLHYENNGLDEDDGGTGARDEGTDGIDNDNDGVVDDPGDLSGANPGEQETQAPFAAPLRGIKITIRVYEPSSKQVRQVTVVQDFLAD